MLKRSLVLGGAIGLGLMELHDARACSCRGPQSAIVGPDRVDDAALNSRIRLVAPNNTYGNPPPARPSALLRVSDSGAKADVTERGWVDGTQFFIELTPTKPLAANTRYEVAVVSGDPTAFPRTTVLSTFKTGTTSDTTPPALGSVGTPVAKGNAHAGGGDCSITGPWIEITPISAKDPGRPNAKLMYGVWAADAAGNLDTSKPPVALVTPYNDILTVGKRSLCDPHDFPIPAKAPSMQIAIAAIDESGNASPPKKLPKITLSGVGGHP